MTSPLDAIQNLSRTKALVFAGLILGLFFLLSYVVNIPASSNDNLIALLSEAGFDSAKIENVSYDMNGIHASAVTLDSYGFDKIDRLDVRLSWPAFLMKGTVEEIKISGLSLSRRSGEFQPVLQSPLQNLTKMSAYRLIVENAVVDLATSLGDLRFTLNATIDPPADEKGQQTITASIAANQYQLGFDSKWSGTLSHEGALDMSADIVDGRLHLGPLQITRFNGWIVINASAQSFSVQSQLNAGGADLFKVPMQDISLVTDMSGNGSTLLFRSSMAGLKDVTLSSDFSVIKGEESFEIVLKGENLGKFFDRIAAERETNKDVPASLSRDVPFRLQANYLTDRRFSGGPLPFSLEGARGPEKILFGNFLIYADALDIRGSAEIDPALAKGFQTFFAINQDHIDRNFVRLDWDLSKLLGVKKPDDAKSPEDRVNNLSPEAGSP